MVAAVLLGFITFGTTSRMAYTHRFFSPVPKQLEQLLAEELKQLGARNIRQTIAGCFFDGTLTLGYRVALWSRLANTVLIPVEHIDARSPEELYDGMRQIRWADHFDVHKTFKITFHAHNSAITHNQYGAQVAKDAIVDQFRDHFGTRPTIDTDRPDIHINIHVLQNRATVSLDLAGESLHRRGYRQEGVIAPLKENVASAVLIRAGWPELFARATKKSPISLVDPMCGSGTLLIEAAWMASDTAPGLLRTTFGFHGWHYHDAKAWQNLVQEAQERRTAGMHKLGERIDTIVGFDADPQAVSSARSNLQMAGLSQHIQVHRTEFQQLSDEQIPQTPGLIVTNAPYGERLEHDDRAVGVHQDYGRFLQENLAGWQASVLTGSKELGFQLGLRADKFYKFYNGALETTLLNFDLTKINTISPKTDA